MIHQSVLIEVQFQGRKIDNDITEDADTNAVEEDPKFNLELLFALRNIIYF